MPKAKTQVVMPAQAGIPAYRRGRQKQTNVIIDVVNNTSQAVQGVVIAPNDVAQYIFLLTDEAGDFTDERTITIGEGARVDIWLCYFGKGNVTVKLIYEIQKNARVNHKLLFFGNGRRRLFFDEKYKFTSTGAYGRFSVQGLVTDEAVSNAVGNIMIEPGAQKTDSRLEMSGYILSEHAQATMVPSLQVQANDVKAGHAGKVSQLNDEQLFYLQSRGLTKQQARQLFVEGLFLGFVEGMESGAARERVLGMAKEGL